MRTRATRSAQSAVYASPLGDNATRTARTTRSRTYMLNVSGRGLNRMARRQRMEAYAVCRESERELGTGAQLEPLNEAGWYGDSWNKFDALSAIVRHV